MTQITDMTITRRQTLAGLAATTALAGLSGCATLAKNAAPVTLTPDEMLDAIAGTVLENEPERATGLGVDTGQYAALRGQLKDQSGAGQTRYAASLRKRMEEAREYPRELLTPEQITSFEVVESAFSTAIDGFALPYGDVAVGSWRNAPYVVIQNVGTYIDMPRFLDGSQPLADAADAEAYVARLEAMPGALGGELERMQATTGMGVIPPDFLLAKAITQMQGTLKDAMQGGALIEPLTRSDLPAVKAVADKAKEIVSGKVAPALEGQLAELYRQQKLAKSDPGMSARPHGDEYYAWALRASTNTRLTPEEVHERGLEEVAALHARMDPILRDIGYTNGTVGARMTALSQDPRYKFTPGDPGRAEIMAFLEERIAWIKAQMPRAFNRLVDPNLEVRRIPVNEEAGAPGAYGGSGSKDGTIPGRMWINLRTTDLHRKYDLADLAYHETIPGHIWEGEFSNTLPLIRSILAFNAFSEGWALYAEQLADELGAYDDFVVGRLGYLQSLAFRACRMVVDTGLHHKRWSRAKAIDFFVTQNGSNPDDVASEVDRYCSWPGQACGYKVGHSEIVRQRGLAQKALGSRYDLKDFNDAIVRGGNAPLDVMAKNVARYVSGASG